MKSTCAHLILLFAIALMIVAPVLADDTNTTNTTTTVATTVETTPVTTAETTPATSIPTTTMVATTTSPAEQTTTAPPATTGTTAPVTTITTVATTVTTAPVSTVSTGEISVASSPLGAAILIDGVYRGTTPVNVTGLASGTHMLQLELSGYNDYEGTIYVVAGQSSPVYGTLHPMGGTSSQIIVATASAPATTVAPVTTVPQTTSTTSAASSESPLENPTVLAALIGIITAAIGAGATIFTHNASLKKEEKKEEKQEKP